MVGMFDAGLRAANSSSNYDKARALANANLETVKGMSFSSVGSLTSCPREDPPVFTCSITDDYVYLNAANEFRNSGAGDPKDMLRVTIKVEWGSSNSYSTTGLVSR